MQDKRVRETGGYAGRIKTSQRFLMAAVRAPDLDLPHLRDLSANIELAEQALRLAAQRLYQEGASWSDIGKALGVSKQAAYERFRVAWELPEAR